MSVTRSASVTACRSSSDSSPSRPWCGLRPMATISWTRNSNSSGDSCGTTATRARPLRGVPDPQVAAEQAHRARCGVREPAARRTQVDLPVPLGPRTAVSSPGSTCRWSPRNTGLAPVREDDVLERQGRAHRRTSRSRLHSSAKKKGPPMPAVRTPTGSCTGWRSVLAPASARTRKAAPPAPRPARAGGGRGRRPDAARGARSAPRIR